MANDDVHLAPLSTGEVIQLTTGGLQMTVRCGSAVGIECDWLDNEGRHQRATFWRSQLIRLPDIMIKAQRAEKDSVVRALQMQMGGER